MIMSFREKTHWVAFFALIVALLIAAGSVYGASGAWMPEPPPPPPAAETPSW